METFKGLVYVKYGRVGSKSEGPDYYLQTRDKEYLLKYAERYLWELDYYLEFFCRKFVEVTGELDMGTTTIKIKSVREICVGLIPQKDEVQSIEKTE
ncbi:hypothetical protein ACSAZL_10810 [Methanosarcina sp. T3]|uniref:hypothetical protein n=1 Tax=Methanosarcina sp. T3 TaxID=3439062 RepID=UPI003F87150F